VLERIGNRIARDADRRPRFDFAGGKTPHRQIGRLASQKRKVGVLIADGNLDVDTSGIADERAQVVRIFNDVLVGEDLASPRPAANDDAGSVCVLHLAVVLGMIGRDAHRDQDDRRPQRTERENERVLLPLRRLRPRIAAGQQDDCQEASVDFHATRRSISAFKAAIPAPVAADVAIAPGNAGGSATASTLLNANTTGFSSRPSSCRIVSTLRRWRSQPGFDASSTCTSRSASPSSSSVARNALINSSGSALMKPTVSATRTVRSSER